MVEAIIGIMAVLAQLRVSAIRKNTRRESERARQREIRRPYNCYDN